MNRFCAVTLTALALVFVVGCGGNQGLGIKEGDKLVVTQRLERERFEASYGENVKSITNTNGALIEIPEGTVLEVFVTPKSGAKTIEARIVKATVPVEDSTGATTEREIEGVDELTPYFIQDRYRTYDFLYYTISLSADYLNTKIKKIE